MWVRFGASDPSCCRIQFHRPGRRVTGASVSLAGRLDRVRSRMNEIDVDALLVTAGSDLRYMAGYDALVPSRLTCYIVPAGADPVLVAPELEGADARQSLAAQAGVSVRTWSETEDPADLIAAILPREAVRVALSGRTWFDHVVSLQRAAGARLLVSATEILAHARARKTADEVMALREAADAVDKAFSAFAAGEVSVYGRTERDVFRDVRELLVASGHMDSVGNLASGPNSAIPHHKPGDRVLGEGDVLLIDVAGEMSSGYRSDCTRMFCLGVLPDDEFSTYFEVVDAANAAACSAVRPGVLASVIDQAARDVITAAGYGTAFVHRTGHGIGLDVHEAPFIVAGNDTPLEEGMCFSIEPGIYFPGRHGARIEDIVTVTADGAERLNRATHELAILAS